MSDLRCDTCRYWVKWSADPRQGECRIYPPSPVTNATGVWPSTHAVDWCGEWEGRTALPIVDGQERWRGAVAGTKPTVDEPRTPIYPQD